MTLEQLKMLKYLAEQGSLKAASEKLYKTQPAISQGLKHLESYLGVNLFDRSGYRLELTKEGHKIYQHALKLLNEASEIKQIAQHLNRGHESSITLSIEASFDLKRFLPWLEKIQSEFPRTQIQLNQEHISGAFEAVEEGTADIAITAVDSLKLESGVFDSKLLVKGNLINIAAPRFLMRHPNLEKVNELSDEYQIVVQDSGQSSEGKNYSVQTGQRCWYVNDFYTKKILISSGMGWGRLPEYMIEDELNNGSLLKLKLEDIKTELILNYHALKLRTRVLGPVATRFWESF